MPPVSRWPLGVVERRTKDLLVISLEAQDSRAAASPQAAWDSAALGCIRGEQCVSCSARSGFAYEPRLMVRQASPLFLRKYPQALEKNTKTNTKTRMLASAPQPTNSPVPASTHDYVLALP